MAIGNIWPTARFSVGGATLVDGDDSDEDDLDKKTCVRPPREGGP